MLPMDLPSLTAARKTLGLDEFVTLEEIRAAYKKLAAEWHPDRHAGDAKPVAEAKFQQITHAHDLLQAYVSRYCYSFKEADVRRSLMDPVVRAHLQRYDSTHFNQ